MNAREYPSIHHAVLSPVLIHFSGGVGRRQTEEQEEREQVQKGKGVQRGVFLNLQCIRDVKIQHPQPLDRHIMVTLEKHGN